MKFKKIIAAVAAAAMTVCAFASAVSARTENVVFTGNDVTEAGTIKDIEHTGKNDTKNIEVSEPIGSGVIKFEFDLFMKGDSSKASYIKVMNSNDDVLVQVRRASWSKEYIDENGNTIISTSSKTDYYHLNIELDLDNKTYTITPAETEGVAVETLTGEIAADTVDFKKIELFAYTGQNTVNIKNFTATHKIPESSYAYTVADQASFADGEEYSGNATAAILDVSVNNDTIDGLNVTYLDTTETITTKISDFETVTVGVIIPDIITVDGSTFTITELN